MLADVAAEHTDLTAVCGEGETVLTSQRLVGLRSPLLRAQPATLLLPSSTRAAVTRVLGLLVLTTLGQVLVLLVQESRFECAKCDSRFRWNSGLTAHVKTKPYRTFPIIGNAIDATTTIKTRKS